MRELKALKIKGVQRGKKKKKRHFLLGRKKKKKSCYFFITPFHLHFKDDF